MYPLTHAVNDELVKLLIEQQLDIVSFWRTVVSMYDHFSLLICCLIGHAWIQKIFSGGSKFPEGV